MRIARRSHLRTGALRRSRVLGLGGQGQRKDKGHGRGHGPPGQTVVVPQTVRVVVPTATAPPSTPTTARNSGPAAVRPAWPKKAMAACLRARPKSSGPWGQPLPPAVVYYPVPPVLMQQLAPVPPGYEYVRVDNDVLLMDMVNRMVADVIDDLNEPD